MNKFGCRIGVHTYGVWSRPYRGTGKYYQFRYCTQCRKIVVRPIEVFSEEALGIYDKMIAEEPIEGSVEVLAWPEEA